MKSELLTKIRQKEREQKEREQKEREQNEQEIQMQMIAQRELLIASMKRDLGDDYLKELHSLVKEIAYNEQRTHTGAYLQATRTIKDLLKFAELWDSNASFERAQKELQTNVTVLIA